MGDASYTELVQRIATQNADAREAEAEICRRFAPRIRLYGLRHLRDEERARDLVQVVLMATIEAIRAGRLESPEHLDRFVLGTARNSALRIHETEGRLVPRQTEELDVEKLELDLHAIDTEALFRCLAALEGRPRVVVQLTFQEERSADEIAASLGTTPSNVRVLRHRALAQLRSCLDGRSDRDQRGQRGAA